MFSESDLSPFWGNRTINLVIISLTVIINLWPAGHIQPTTPLYQVHNWIKKKKQKQNKNKLEIILDKNVIFL